MNILFITTMWGGAWGGSEVLWSSTAKLAIENGHKVFIYYPEMGEPGSHLQQLTNAGAVILKGKKVSTTPTLTDRLKKKLVGKGKFLGEKRLEQLLKSVKLHAICVSQGGTYDFTYEKNLSQIVAHSGIPYTIVCHHNYENGVTYGEVFRKHTCAVFAGAVQVCFVSARNRHVTEIQLAAAIPNAVIVDNPIQVAKAMLPWPKNDGVLMLAFTGRLNVKNKGLDMMMDALAQCKDHPTPWLVNVYGKGNDEVYVKELVQFLHLEDRVIFKGYEPDIIKIWSQHEALLLSSANEGTPLVTVEAMCCGRPVIGTDVGDNDRFIINHSTGILIAAPFAPVIKAAFTDLLNNRHQLQQWGKNAFAHVQNETKADATQAFLQLITDKAKPGK